MGYGSPAFFIFRTMPIVSNSDNTSNQGWITVESVSSVVSLPSCMSYFLLCLVFLKYSEVGMNMFGYFPVATQHSYKKKLLSLRQQWPCIGLRYKVSMLVYFSSRRIRITVSTYWWWMLSTVVSVIWMLAPILIIIISQTVSHLGTWLNILQALAINGEKSILTGELSNHQKSVNNMFYYSAIVSLHRLLIWF